MWIAHVTIGHKKLAALAVGSIIAVLITRHNQAWSMAVYSSIAMLWLCILISCYVLCIWVERYRFRSLGHTYEILDYYLPRTPSENKRILRDVKTQSVESTMYLRRQTRWLYFDQMRQMLADTGVASSCGNALIIGGGGGVIANLLARDYGFTRVDVVEASAKMIRVAKKYFFPHQLPNLIYYRAYASSFVNRALQRYDFIFVDIFQSDMLDNELGKGALLKKMKRLLSPGGLLIMNLGFKSHPEEISQYFPDLMYGVLGKNLIGFWSRHAHTIVRSLKNAHIPNIASHA